MILRRQEKYFDEPAKKNNKLQLPKTDEEFRARIKEAKDESYRRGREAGYKAGEENTLARLKKIRDKKGKIVKGVKSWAGKNKTGLIITASGLAASGLTVAGVKVARKKKEDKKATEIKKKLRGYEK